MSVTTLGEITSQQRQLRPDKVALRFPVDSRQWTYRELDDEACRVANALRLAGVGNQSRIGYLGKNLPEYFTYLFGGAKLNAVTVAVNWRLASPEMEYILNHSESQILLIAEEYLPRLAEMELELEQVVVIGNPGSTPYPSYEDWIRDQPASCPVHLADPDEPCFQLYTSGTTGLPKGVETTHRNVLSMASNSIKSVAYSPDSVSLVCMPLFHIAGAGWAVFGVTSGGTTILLPEPDLQGILKAIPECGVTHTVFVPAVLQFLLEQPNIGDADLSSMQGIVYGASPISEKVLSASMQTFGCSFYGVYGLTETTGTVTRLDPEDHDPGGTKAGLMRSCGKPANGHEIKIIDSETGAEKAEGEVGEICIRGPQVMKGYWKNEQATGEAIDADGWFRSGDAGYMIDGYVYIHDRVKDMIISGGENIYPAEVENVLMTHPGVADVAIIGVPDERWGETVKAMVVRSDPQLAETELIDFCRERLAHYKCPTSVDWMDLLPRNPSGKILKTQLREPYWEGRQRKV